MTLLDVAEILEAAAGKARELANLHAAERREWVGQEDSPLGRRRHIQAVRRRLAAGLDGAGRSGRRYLLSADALAEELARPAEPKAETETTDYGDKMRDALRLVGGGRL